MTVRLVCAGDSNTRGQYGVSYVRMLEQRLRGHDVAVTGSGVNGETSYGLLQRLDPIIEQRPTVVTILIGTNDLWGTLNDANAGALIRRNRLPYPPSAQHFQRHLQTIVARLQSATDARIALVSPPVLGQQLDSSAVRGGHQFAQIVAETAAYYGVDNIPLFENQHEYLLRNEAAPLPLPAGLKERYSSVLQHVLLGRPYDRISQRRGLLLTTDHVHQNTRGAAMIADLVEGYIGAAQPDIVGP